MTRCATTFLVFDIDVTRGAIKSELEKTRKLVILSENFVCLSCEESPSGLINYPPGTRLIATHATQARTRGAHVGGCCLAYCV